ncbi:MAG: tetratricopeptide repeat protein [Bacteroidetes bacterium]|jgi:serine/threonine-protein kinase|nr:tetratricopeptide repeat protein [Bacteroidota bacterium]
MEPSGFEHDNWQRIGDLFAEALEHPPDARAAFLDVACAGAPALRAEVEALLSAYAKTDDFLQALDPQQAAALISTAGETVEPGQTVGPYRLRRELGRGGMGVVYLADRADGQFEQQVALKVVKRGMDTDAILRRFLHERQILARLQHPNIARLLDGGMTDTGLPYFAMEYVEGEPITDYCDRHRLGIQERLHLFRTVGTAVQYAHRNLVVHRDLKPSNVLVTDDGQVKLLDFGIAKLLDDTEGLTLQTVAGLRPMTPEYAAPEQVQGEALTTSTDVYSLGVLLYELLTGHRPYRFERRAPDAIAQVVAGATPTQPSTAVQHVEEIRQRDGTTTTITPEQVSQRRSTEPTRLRRRLAGDLDTIVLMALRKEPHRRYASAEAFVEDVRRHLDGLPVQARPTTLGYRVAAFVRRHRVGVAAAAVVVLALLVGLGAALWQAQKAAQEARTATQVKDFALSLFELADPDVARGQEVTARELLRQGAVRAEDDLAGQPEAQANMFLALGEIHYKLDETDEAQRLLERARTQYRTLYGPTHVAVARTEASLGNVLIQKGEYATARKHFETARDLYRDALGTPSAPLADVLHDLAVLSRRRGNNEAAERLHRRALAMREATRGPSHPSVAQSQKNLALVLHAQGQYEEAETLYRAALALHIQHFGETHRQVGTNLNSLASLLRDRGQYAEAGSLYTRSLHIARELFGDTHASVATSTFNIGGLLLVQGRPAEAQRHMEEALAITRRLYDADHPSVATMLNGLATALRDQERYAEALPYFEEALAIYQNQLGPTHHFTGIALVNLGKTRLGLGELREADSLFRRSLTILRDAMPPGHDAVAHPLYGLGRVRLAQQRIEDAEPLLRDAYEIRRTKLGPTHPRTARAQSAYGACLSLLGRHEQAEPLLTESLDVLRATYPTAHAEVTTAQRRLSGHYARAGR